MDVRFHPRIYFDQRRLPKLARLPFLRLPRRIETPRLLLRPPAKGDVPALPGLIGERVVDSKFNQVILTPDTHFIVDWHPEHDNLLLAGGCSGHLFKHGPIFGDFVAGVGLKEYGTADRFKIAGRKKLSPRESPSGR